MYVPKGRVLNYEGKSLIIERQGEINETTISVGDFSALCIRNIQFQWQNSKDIVELSIINQLDYNGHLYRLLHLEIIHILLKLTNWSIHQDQSHLEP